MISLGFSPKFGDRLRDRARATLRRYPGFWRAVLLFAGYTFWIAIFRLLFLTFITYFVMSSPSTSSARHFEDVSEAFGSSEIGIVALAALTFVVIAKALNPLSRTSIRTLFSRSRLERAFVPGFSRGAVLATGIAIAYLLAGTHRYLGFFIQTEDAALAILNVGVRFGSLFILAYFEEYLFREKMLGFLSNKEEEKLWPVVLVSVFYCFTKALQFELGLMHLVTLFLLSMLLTLRARAEKNFGWGAGYWSAILIVFNALLSLPVLGNDFSGVLLLKYQSMQPGLTEETDITVRLLTGGAGGPLSSFAFQALLALELLRSSLWGSMRGVIRDKKMLLSRPSQKLR